MSDHCCLSTKTLHAGRCLGPHQRARRWGAGVALTCVLLSGAACGDATASVDRAAPAVVDTVPGQDTKTVTLTEQAVGRLRISTATVAEGDGGTSVPYAAIGYDPDGATWVYTNPQPLTYMREPVTVKDVQEGTAVLSSGPAVGTAVVTVGVAELFGAEKGIGQ